MPHHYNPPSFIYRSPRYTSSPPPSPGSPRMERGPHGEWCPHPETFLTYLSTSPVKALPPRPPPRSLFSVHPYTLCPQKKTGITQIFLLTQAQNTTPDNQHCITNYTTFYLSFLISHKNTSNPHYKDRCYLSDNCCLSSEQTYLTGALLGFLLLH